MDQPGSTSPEDYGEAHWRTAGDRIQTLLDASAAGGPVAAERAEQLVREVVDLYGAGLSRIVELLDDPTLARLAGDNLAASLLLVHGLHPHDVHRRVADALEQVRPYLGSHGGDVALLDVTDSVVHLQFSGSCKSCPSSSVTLELAVEDAVRAAAPEIAAIEVVSAEPAAAAVIPVESLMTRVHANGHAWHPVPELADLQPGEVGGFAIGGTTVLACRVGEHLYAYRDRCGSCDESLAGAALHRWAGHPANSALLRCPRCHAHFDVVHAGVGIGIDETSSPPPHLDPVPLLERDGVLSLAMMAETSGVG